MYKRTFIIFCVAVSLLSARAAAAYEQVTHAEMTKEVWERYSADHPDIFFQLGLWQPFKDLGDKYYEANDGGGGHLVWRHDIGSFEKRTITTGDTYSLGYLDSILQTPTGYMMVGAVQEDDSSRALNHFFDPVNNIALQTTSFSSSFTRNPMWALGRDDFQIAAGSGRGSNLTNHFTLFDIREYMYRALTGQRFSDGMPATEGGSVATELQRMQYWASAFRAIGDMLHLVEDMGQPQHTRNESHNGIFGYGHSGSPIVDALGVIAGAPADYEHYSASQTSPGRIGTASSTYTTTPSNFNKFSDFWTTAVQQVEPGGKGLADFSNHEFYTPAHNINASAVTGVFGNVRNYVYPKSELLTPVGRIVNLATLSNGANPFMTYYQGTVTDYQANSSAVVNLSASSNLYPGSYTMDNVVYQDMLSQLAPRAIGYAHGVLNHLFRAKLEVSEPKIGVYSIVDHAALYNVSKDATDQGFNKIRATVKNSSSGSSCDDSKCLMSGGKLVAVLRFHRNGQYTHDLSKEPNAPGQTFDQAHRNSNEEVAVSTSTSVVTYDADGAAQLTDASSIVLNPGDSREYEFHFGGGGTNVVLPLNATDVYLEIIYRGQLGTTDDTDAIVIATKNISEPTYVNIYNGSQYIEIDKKAYTRDTVNSRTDLLAKVDPSCLETGQLKSTCYLPINFNAKFDVRNPIPEHNPLIQIDQMTPDEFSQIVILVDGNIQLPEGVADLGGVNMRNELTFKASSDPLSYEYPCSSARNPEPWYGSSIEHQFVVDPSAPATYQSPIDRTMVGPPLNIERGVRFTTETTCINKADFVPNDDILDIQLMSAVPSPSTPKPVTLNF